MAILLIGALAWRRMVYPESERRWYHYAKTFCIALVILMILSLFAGG